MSVPIRLVQIATSRKYLLGLDDQGLLWKITLDAIDDPDRSDPDTDLGTWMRVLTPTEEFRHWCINLDTESFDGKEMT
jgi:hypothetical protein